MSLHCMFVAKDGLERTKSTLSLATGLLLRLQVGDHAYGVDRPFQVNLSCETSAVASLRTNRNETYIVHSTENKKTLSLCFSV